MSKTRVTQSAAGNPIIHVPQSYYVHIEGYEDNRLTLDQEGRERCNKMAKDLMGHKARTLLRHIPLLGSSLLNNYQSLLATFKQDCMRKVPNSSVQPSTSSAFWATTPFQVIGAAQQLGRDLDNAAQSPLVAPILGAAAFLGLTAAAVSQLRFGNTAPLQRLVEAL